MNYKEQRHNDAEMTEREVLATIEHIVDNAGATLTCSELEKLSHCWHIIKDIYAAMVYAKQKEAM